MRVVALTLTLGSLVALPSQAAVFSGRYIESKSPDTVSCQIQVARSDNGTVLVQSAPIPTVPTALGARDFRFEGNLPAVPGNSFDLSVTCLDRDGLVSPASNVGVAIVPDIPLAPVLELCTFMLPVNGIVVSFPCMVKPSTP